MKPDRGILAATERGENGGQKAFELTVGTAYRRARTIKAVRGKGTDRFTLYLARAVKGHRISELLPSATREIAMGKSRGYLSFGASV